MRSRSLQHGDMERGHPESARGRLRGILVDCGACPYLPERHFHAFHAIDPAIGTTRYRELLDLGFRRSGDHVYRPLCQGCQECRPIRVDVARFAPRRDQSRCRRRNADLTVTWHPRGCDRERLELFARYQRAVHDDEDPHEDAPGFLIADAAVDGGELHARDERGRLLAVSVCDRFADAPSSVYCYYDPGLPRRSLGTLMVLAEIEHARRCGLSWLYLGFMVGGCRKMRYKARFTPHQILIDGRWATVEQPPREPD